MSEPLADMSTLEMFILINNPITDKGLQEIKWLGGLTRIALNNTKVTAAAVADLQQALPKCKIEWDAPKN